MGVVVIGSASGETRALVTLDPDYAQKVTAAVNGATVGRG